MNPEEFIETQPAERQQILHELHKIILSSDANVIPIVEPMMGKEMIIYKERGYMKYGLASGKTNMSFHCLPMYMHPPPYNRFQTLLPGAKFQKGCINFTDGKMMPIEAVSEGIRDAAMISIVDMLEARKKLKKK